MPAQQVVPITADIDMESLALIGCAVTTVGAVLNTAKVESGSTVAVIGTGGVGLNVVQGAVVAGASGSSPSTCWTTSSTTPARSAPPTW